MTRRTLLTRLGALLALPLLPWRAKAAPPPALIAGERLYAGAPVYIAEDGRAYLSVPPPRIVHDVPPAQENPPRV